MSDALITGLISVALAVVSVAAIATIFSRNAQAPQVIQASTGGLATDILAAVSPVTGQTPQIASQF